jgi:hypothetical protein
MKWRSIPIAAGLWLAAAVAQAQVLACTDHGLTASRDGRLQRIARQLLDADPSLAFQADPAPCVHARASARALAATVGIDPWRSLGGFEYLRVVRGRNWFTVERLVIPDARRRQALAARLAQHRPPKLAIKANTVYQARVVGNSLMLMVSPAAGREANALLFERLQGWLAD